MRRIGSLNDGSHATHFCDYLVTLSIDAIAEQDGDQGWDIWVRDEAHLEKARSELADFQKQPDDTRYQVSDVANKIRLKKVEEHQRRRKNVQNYSQKMTSRGGGAMGSFGARQQNIPVTIGIIVISVICSFSTHFSSPRPSNDPGRFSLEQKTFFSLSFVDLRDYVKSEEDSFASIRKGQIWRAVTPMFLHGSALHLAFNMLWVYMLGAAVERMHGSLFFGLLMVLTHVGGMALQVTLPGAESLPAVLHRLAGSPFAVGASGAVYGVFGYLWIRPIIDPRYPLRIGQQNIVLMLVWLVACVFVINGVANGGHIGGLLSGMLAAYVVVNFLQPNSNKNSSA